MIKKPSEKDHRPIISHQSLADAIDKIEEQLSKKLDQKGYGAWLSRHEILGIMTEEYKELTEAVQSKDISEVHAELIDIAVGCIFALACIDSKTLDW